MATVPIIFRFVPEMVTTLEELRSQFSTQLIEYLESKTIEVFSRDSTQRQVEAVLPRYASHITEIQIAEKFHKGTDGVAPVGAVHIYDDVHFSVDIFSNHTNGADRRFLKTHGIPIRDFDGPHTGLMPDPNKRSRKTSQTRDRTHGKRTAKADVEAGTRHSSNAHDGRNATGRSFSTYAPGTHYGGSLDLLEAVRCYPVSSFQHHGPVFAGHQPQPGNPMAPGFAGYGNIPGMMPNQSHVAGGSMPHSQHVNATPGPSQHMGHVPPGAVLPPGPFYGQRNQGIGMPMQYAQPGTAYPVPVFTSQQPPQLYGRDMTQEQWDAMRRAGWSANTASGGASSSGASSSNIRGQGR
ncbi:hypothetical protein A0H81_03273 [Grifola frondosa]|uniref:Uncharacterized protein n=1 Tax=Grifola frondosa TaxID=5627 RepID=A0A1C7MGW2_GRIFR|nr:hypothetical protein A0H81_03273 [Grifola frondosa]